MEFRAIKDDVTDKGHRIITEARMYGFGVVDKPAYPGSVATMKRWDEYRTEYGLHVPEPEEATTTPVTVSRFVGT